MPTWASILVAIISALVGPICVVLVNRHIKKIEQQEQTSREERKEERRREIKEVVDDSIAPLRQDLQDANSKLTAVSEGTLSTLRNDITVCYYRCHEKHYRNDYDYENLHHMYKAYQALHGNSYIADIVTRFDQLPTKEQYKHTHPQDKLADDE